MYKGYLGYILGMSKVNLKCISGRFWIYLKYISVKSQRISKVYLKYISGNSQAFPRIISRKYRTFLRHFSHQSQEYLSHILGIYKAFL